MDLSTVGGTTIVPIPSSDVSTLQVVESQWSNVEGLYQVALSQNL